MLAELRNLHRFAASQSFYPLLLASLLAVFFFIGRAIYSGTLNYVNLVWNLFLAWVPYVFSVIAAILHRLLPKDWWLLPIPGIAWLAFFPNAPYMVTDFYHLGERPPVPLWYDIGLIAIFAFTGCFLAIASLHTMHRLVEVYLGKIVGWTFVSIALALSGSGIYLGRFERWNTWDLLLHPLSIFKDIASRVLNPLDHLRFIGFTLMFTAILLVFYLMFISMSSRFEKTGS
jgi:uncharacterized membrane protein